MLDEFNTMKPLFFSLIRRNLNLTSSRATWALLPVLASVALCAPSARAADETGADFAVVATTDPLYKHLAAIRRAGWGAPATGAPVKKGATVKVKTPLQAMTRYEMALETARAYFALAARRGADAKWTPGAGSGAVRSLRELISGLRPELQRLDLDVAESLAFCDALLRQKAGEPAPRVASPSSGRSFVGSAIPRGVGNVPLSQRLRVYAALSSLVRESADPFGDNSRGTLGLSGFSLPSNRRLDDATRPRAFSAGTALSVTDWLRLRADYGRQNVSPFSDRARFALQNGRLPLSVLALPGATGQSEIGGGVEVDLPLGFNVSGGVSRVSPLGLNVARNELLRVGGGVGLSAWQNRLSLSANLSRLVPSEDSALLSSQAAEFNLDIGVTQRLRLQLLYQELFGSPAQARNGRVVVGGLKFSF